MKSKLDLSTKHSTYKKAAKSKRAAQSAVRSYLHIRFAWLHGFPFVTLEGDLLWQTVPHLGASTKPEKILVDREKVRKTEYHQNAIKRIFPRALPRVVGDVNIWTKHISARLDIVKATVHSNKPLPSAHKLISLIGFRRSAQDTITQYLDKHASLEPLILSFLWMHWHDEKSLFQNLELIDRHACSLSSLFDYLEHQKALLLSLLSLQLILEKQNSTFLELLSDKRTWLIPLSHGDFHGKLNKELQSLRTKNPSYSLIENNIPRPKPQFGPHLVEFILTAYSLPKTIRSRQLKILEQFMTEDILSYWDNWWKMADQYEREAKKIFNAHKYKQQNKHETVCEDVRHRIRENLETSTVFNWKDLNEQFSPLCVQAPKKIFDIFCSILNQLKGYHKGKLIKHIFLETWNNEFNTPDKSWPRISRLLQAQADLLNICSDLSSEQQAWISRQLTNEITYAWIHEEKPQNLIKPSFKALQHIIQNSNEWDKNYGPFPGQSGYDYWNKLVLAIEVTQSPERAIAIMEDIPTGYEQKEACEALYKLADQCPHKFKQYAKSWQPDLWDTSLSTELLSFTKIPSFAKLLVQAFNLGRGKQVTKLVSLSSLNRSLKLPITSLVPFARSSLDVSPYPKELHELLSELNQWDQNPEQAANKILSSDFPLQKNMQTEKENLSKILQNETNPNKQKTLKARLRRLDRELGTRNKPISEKRLHNYKAKLIRRICHAQLISWETQLTKQFDIGFEQAIGIKPPEDWISRSDVAQILSALTDLKPSFKKLAFRILKTRCGPEPWDLREESKNKSFLNSLKKRGINIIPWLEGIEPKTINVNNRELTLSLEKDPLEIMKMGAPFSTCLSPGSFSFFSVISNAADINKRVIYVRDEKGTIQSRCLIALTNEGQILTFYVYAHFGHDEVSNAIKGFILDLAEDMKTSIIANGKIQHLLAADWYNDGPIDLVGEVEIFALEKRLEIFLKKTEPQDIVAAIKNIIPRGKITQSVICQFARTKAVEKQPQYILPLIPYLGDASSIEHMDILHIISLIRKAGKTKLALSLIEPLSRQMRRHEYQGSWIVDRVAEEFIKLKEPHRALRLIIQSRHRTIRNWTEEYSERLIVAAKAFHALHRPQQALQLYKLASQQGNQQALKAAKKLEETMKSSAYPTSEAEDLPSLL